MSASNDHARRQAEYVRRHYAKSERRIPMRDGVELFTSIYEPRDTSRTYPILMQRTPYGAGPYGEDAYRKRLGPSAALCRDGYVFVYQDVRGRMMSGGEFEAVRPHRPQKRHPTDVDESTDTFDTVDWLLEHVSNHNGRVGVWGISAPGFYATHALIDAHPAVKAVSPQAPVTDWFLGDDRHHNGAFLLQATVDFLSWFGAPRPHPTTEPAERFDGYGTPDGYAWYLDLGPLANADARVFRGDNATWNAMMEHGTYDAFWQARTPLPHLDVAGDVAGDDVAGDAAGDAQGPAVLVTGGFFDTHDLYGPLKTHAALVDAGAECFLAMGPWWHGAWARVDGDRYGPFYFEQNTAEFYRLNIERPFFNHYLKGEGRLGLAPASVFTTGGNRWHFLEAWPPPAARDTALYLQADGGLAFHPPEIEKGFAEYASDPAVPVPHTPDVVIHRDDAYVLKDQRFAARRPDVLVFSSEPLEREVTAAGRLFARLFVSTTGTDADFVVKLIDVYPGEAECELPDDEWPVPMGGFQMLVRGEVMRAKFRRSFEHPEPMEPGVVTELRFDMQDVAHTFRRGHRIMVQIQSSWFPLVDRNPQTFTDVYHASEGAYRKAVHRVYFSRTYASRLEMQLLP